VLSILSLAINSSITTLLLLFIFYLAREFIKNYFFSSIQHEYDKKFEEFQSIIRKDEEERNFIRSAVLNVISSTDNIVKSRQLAAFDDLWLRLIEKKKFTGLLRGFALFNVEALAKMPEDKKIELLKPFSKIDIQNLSNASDKAELVRPWVSAMAWALYSAYEAIIYYFAAQIHILNIGSNPNEFISKESVFELVKAAIPESNIESIEDSSLPKYFEILELKLIVELKNQIKDLPLNPEDIDRANQIAKLASNINFDINSKLTNPPPQNI
jgi:hypothetical protein